MAAVPAAELERIASMLHAVTTAARSNEAQLLPRHLADLHDEVDRFVGLCADHGVEITIDRAPLGEVMHRYRVAA